MPSTRISLRQLMQLHPDGLAIGAYQRHYVWGRCTPGETDAARLITETLISHYSRGESLFLQGITAAPATHELIDGQQRITYLYLLLRFLGYNGPFRLTYACRPDAEEWLLHADMTLTADNPDEPSQDVYFFKHTLRMLTLIDRAGIAREAMLGFLLDNVHFLYIAVDNPADAIPIYKMMNGSKSQMIAADIIKADLMRLASDERQPGAGDWELILLSTRYAAEWDTWMRWWNRTDVREYYTNCCDRGIDLLLTLCLSRDAADAAARSTLTYDMFRHHITRDDALPYHGAKHFFSRLRMAQRKFCDAFADTATYNRVRAILMLQDTASRRKFMYCYFVERSIDDNDLERYYKLSFLGMDIDAIASGEPEAAYFDDLLASLSMADVYHSEVKRDVFNLLLRLNIDEDIKLGRKFDFSVWNNRSLEHIFSKSKVWHEGQGGKIYDGNDNVLRMSAHDIARDKSFIPRSSIRNYDGMQLSEHCIGNIVLLYGQNNAAFGNASFAEKKEMFLRPGDQTVFRSRNLLHSVCVFAGNKWDARSIVDNYNTIIKNLKLYYGFK